MINTFRNISRGFAVFCGLALLLQSPVQAQSCQTQTATGPNLPFDTGTDVSTTFDFSASGLVGINDVTLVLALDHTWVGDITATLTSPGGIVVEVIPTLLDDSSNLLNSSPISFNDSEAASAIDLGDPNPPLDNNAVICQDGGPCAYSPSAGPFTSFNGLAAAADGGLWTIDISDSAGGDPGELFTGDTTLELCAIALPVELSSFNASIIDGEWTLNWTTESETKNAGFEVQQFQGSDWDILGFVEGAGTTLEARSYVFNVEDLDYGIQNFRLKQIDFDGEYEYSNVVEISNELAKGFDLKPFYPNPFNPRGSFTLLTAEREHVTIEVFNVMGQRVQTLFSGPLEAQQHYKFDFTADSSLPSGNYLIQITGLEFDASSMISLVK